jgi:hypothetical protein
LRQGNTYVQFLCDHTVQYVYVHYTKICTNMKVSRKGHGLDLHYCAVRDVRRKSEMVEHMAEMTVEDTIVCSRTGVKNHRPSRWCL